ncbi:MAG: Fe-S cluster assembly protein SufD [Verrucomicrobiales bacterium]|nr:Fe-S cluster assembly protein SufD [Verrucomicrobiales bacterium]
MATTDTTLEIEADAKSKVQTSTSPYWEKFEPFERDTQQPGWVLNARKAGISRFAEMGFPTVQDEDWRFTNVAPIARLPFNPVFELQRGGVSEKRLSQFAFARLAGSKLVFVNGHYAADLSSVTQLPEGAKVTSLAAALASDASLVEKHLFRHARTDANSFVALNTAFFQDGAFIYLPAGKAVAEPVQLTFLSTGREHGAASLPRNLIVAEGGAQLMVIENFVSLTNAACLTNAVTELIVGDSARVEHLKFQDESHQAFHISTVAANFGRASHVITHSIALGAKLSRTNIYATLAGEGVQCILNGLYLTRGEQLADHYMIVEHAQPRGASHEYFNGILADKSKGVFHGRILVRPDAQKTDAKQTNKNLLLSDDATANTKPQLEIYADDVKCTHGATIGQLNDESVFYLRARGIPLEMARRMLIHAFAGEIIDRVRGHPVREELDKLVWDRLEQNGQVAMNK